MKDRVKRQIIQGCFFEHEAIENVELWVNPKTEYSTFLRNKADNEFASTFLDVAGVTALAKSSAWKVLTQDLFSKWLPVCSFVIAFISVVIAVAAYSQLP